MCVITFGDDPTLLLKGYAGPSDLSPVEALPPRDFYRALLEKNTPSAESKGDVAGAVVLAAGIGVGVVCARTLAPRTWTPESREVLLEIAHLAGNELALRAGKQPTESVATILERISDACVFLDRDWRYTYLNRKAGEIFNRDPESLVGKHIWTEFPEGIGQEFYKAYYKAIEEQKFAYLEEFYPPYERWFENRIYPTPDGLAIFFQDITVRKLAEEQRRRDAEVRTQAEQMAHFGHWVWDVKKNRVTWSAELCRIYGLDPSQGGPGASFNDYLARVHPQDRSRVRESIESSLRDRASFTFTERILRPDGEMRHLHSWGKVAVDADGQPTQMFGACLDITELMVAKGGLLRTEEWLGAALRNTRVAVWEWSVQTNQVRWSRDAAKVLGLGPDDLATSFDAYLEHVHGEDRGALIEALRRAVDQGSDVDVEHRVLGVGGAIRWLVARACASRDEGGRVSRLLGTLVDVTERRQNEDERRQLLEKLGHAQKMDGIGRLAAGVAHDFNNHLSIILGAADLLSLEPGLSVGAQESVSSIQRAAESAGTLTKQLLSFSRQRQSAEPSRLDLNHVIGAACKLLQRLLPGNVELSLSLATTLDAVRADREQIERILLNLIVNARDAMPEGGHLEIQTREEDDHAVVEISDTGVGMTPEIQARIFEPFFTTKSDANGTGLGLATVYGIVSQNGGSIDVTSKPGAGSRFTIRLPFATPRNIRGTSGNIG